jgi:putative tryptophan/tyrosine transport system substrate-binding protein
MLSSRLPRRRLPVLPSGRDRSFTLHYEFVRWFVLAVFWLLPLRAFANDAGIWLALSEPGGPYAEAVNALRTQLTVPTGQPRHVDMRVGTWQELLANPGKAPQLIVAIGASAYRGVIEEERRGSVLNDVPVLAILVPRAFYESLAAKAGTPTSAVFLDQPLGRYLDLLRLAMPERRRVGVLLGPESSAQAGALGKAAAARGLLLVTARVNGDDDLYAGLRVVLNDADIILALPDVRVFNSGSLQNILIATYRQHVPLEAFAPGYVKAGATLALYSSPAQAASQAAAMIRTFLAGRPLPAPQMPSDFSVMVNDRVAHSLGLSIDSADELAEQLRRLEEQR